MRIYTVLLCVVCLIALCMALYVFRRKISNRQRVIYILLYLALAYVIYLFPLENLFMSFDSPEEAFAYSCRGEIVSILEGEQSYMVTYRTDEHTTMDMLAAKKDGCYKIENAFLKKIICVRLGVQCTISVVNARGTGDYYIYIMGDTGTPPLSITDNVGTTYRIHQEEFYDIVSFTAEAVVEDLDEDFCITIGEHTYKVFD